MNKKTAARRRLLAVIVSLVCAAGPLAAQQKACDRNCLKGLAHQVLVSMAKHDATVLPLARWSSSRKTTGPWQMSVLWRTITGFTEPAAGQYVIDVAAGQVIVIATVKEGTMPSLLWGRLKKNGKISELELSLPAPRRIRGCNSIPRPFAFPGCMERARCCLATGDARGTDSRSREHL